MRFYVKAMTTGVAILGSVFLLWGVCAVIKDSDQTRLDAVSTKGGPSQLDSDEMRSVMKAIGIACSAPIGRTRLAAFHDRTNFEVRVRIDMPTKSDAWSEYERVMEPYARKPKSSSSRHFKTASVYKLGWWDPPVPLEAEAYFAWSPTPTTHGFALMESAESESRMFVVFQSLTRDVDSFTLKVIEKGEPLQIVGTPIPSNVQTHQCEYLPTSLESQPAQVR